MKFTKFSKIETMADKYGKVREYQSYYDEEIEKSKHLFETSKHPELEDGYIISNLIAKSEKRWFENHNPCFNATYQIIQKLKSLNIQFNINIDYMPFDTYAICFPKNLYSYKIKENGEVRNLNGVILSKTNYTLNVIFYESDKNRNYMFLQSFILDSIKNIEQIKELCHSNRKIPILSEIIDIVLRIGFLSSAQMSLEEDKKSLISIQSKKQKNTSIIFDIHYDNYVRYLKPIWDNTSKKIENTLNKQYHYQFTRKGHWRRIREKGTNKVKKVVWIRNAVIREDLPKKVELLSS